MCKVPQLTSRRSTDSPFKPSVWILYGNKTKKTSVLIHPSDSPLIQLLHPNSLKTCFSRLIRWSWHSLGPDNYSSCMKMTSLAIHVRPIRAGEMLGKPPKPCIKTFVLPNAEEDGPNLLCKCLPALPSPPCLATVTVAWPRGGGGLLVLLTGILCVDECAGLMAQCAYLIGAAPLSH